MGPLGAVLGRLVLVLGLGGPLGAILVALEAVFSLLVTMLG